MATNNMDSNDLKTALVDGLVNESVMKKITILSQNLDTPLSDMIGTGSHGNEYHSWTQDTNKLPNPVNAQVDGRDSTENDAVPGTRTGNHSQISTKDIAISTRADTSDTIGFQKASAHQLMMRSEDLRRDVEAGMCSNNISRPDNGDATAGLSGGLQAWLSTNSFVASDGSLGGFNTSTGIVDAVTNGTAEALTETKIRDAAQKVYQQGGNPSKLLMVPDVCRQLSSYMFTSSARIATLTSETTQSNSAATAKGSVNVMVTDFNVTLDFVPSRTMRNYDYGTTDAESCAFLIDTSKLQLSWLHGIRAERLAKNGLSERWLMSGDWTLVVDDEKAHACINSIDNTAAVTA